MRLVVARDALADLQRLHQFLASKDVTAARKAAESLDTAMKSLLSLPERGIPFGIAGMRELIVPFGASAYVIRYAHFVDRSEIVVVRIWHGREERA